ncbi:hypothetical protein PENTCL1PPCAC_11962 [Pristionchus entomophagus]|uniref:Uncharacterized protein n=1 Tax=Pristionchus entomophagus TaxID=358040 RepID=A0AAV5T2H7_9BILA|nr:hypothetical protein PENTCL1PPCAC_11962 [Pristionchus entomophagus]
MDTVGEKESERGRGSIRVDHHHPSQTAPPNRSRRAFFFSSTSASPVGTPNRAALAASLSRSTPGLAPPPPPSVDCRFPSALTGIPNLAALSMSFFFVSSSTAGRGPAGDETGVLDSSPNLLARADFASSAAGAVITPNLRTRSSFLSVTGGVSAETGRPNLAALASLTSPAAGSVFVADVSEAAADAASPLVVDESPTSGISRSAASSPLVGLSSRSFSSSTAQARSPGLFRPRSSSSSAVLSLSTSSAFLPAVGRFLSLRSSFSSGTVILS